jgi:hypothetical protein
VAASSPCADMAEDEQPAGEQTEILGELTVRPIGHGDVDWVELEPPEDTQDDRASDI